MAVLNPFDFFLEAEYENFPFRYGSGERHELGLFLEAPPPGPRLKAFLASVDRQKVRTSTFWSTSMPG